ncbi:MAG TPA: molybdopterin-dependent oxidoreductase [Candidatus Dormibacteraeota bacterium]|nr:molybdopterin-dependent oxidoreductase [Candidatus Dormibacteraeota bacterium]
MGRRTNLALLGLLAAAFLTGWLAFAFGTAPARWSLVVHALGGFGVLALLPWKSIVARRGLRRARPARWASVVLAALVIASLVGGLLHSTGLLRWWGPYTAMELHVGAAIGAVPFAVWHVVARPVRPRRLDLSRRNLLRAGIMFGAAGAGYAASELAVRATRLPGAARRFTGSYEIGSFDPDLMPVSSWLLDAVPTIAPDAWRLRVVTPDGIREWGYAELLRFDDRWRAVLDCTGGFWSEQDWSGVLLSRLVPDWSAAVSVRVTSHTGYDRRFDVRELPDLLLALRLGDRPLSPDHGAPARLVAPNRRGFWWVKWVRSIELDTLPPWWQSPFPLQ